MTKKEYVERNVGITFEEGDISVFFLIEVLE